MNNELIASEKQERMWRESLCESFLPAESLLGSGVQQLNLEKKASFNAKEEKGVMT